MKTTMRRLYILVAVAVMMAMGVGAQEIVKKIRLYKGNEIVAEQNYAELDSIVFVDVEIPAVLEGALAGKFTINANGDQVNFSQGNLQYVGTWQFAPHQWDCFGDSQSDNHRDLFGWGTGDVPNKVSENDNDYSSFVDWGVNPITNGGNEANVWRTLTKDEWYYLFYTRENAATLFALGSVNDVNGTILLPDNWELPEGVSFTTSTTQGLADDVSNSNGEFLYDDNTYTIDQWKIMESAGAVFLPAAGVRFCSYPFVGEGFYWSATPYYGTSSAYCIYFGSDFLNPQYDFGRSYGLSVRLVR